MSSQRSFFSLSLRHCLDLASLRQFSILGISLSSPMLGLDSFSPTVLFATATWSCHLFCHRCTQHRFLFYCRWFWNCWSFCFFSLPSISRGMRDMKNGPPTPHAGFESFANLRDRITQHLIPMGIYMCLSRDVQRFDSVSSQVSTGSQGGSSRHGQSILTCFVSIAL